MSVRCEIAKVPNLLCGFGTFLFETYKVQKGPTENRIILLNVLLIGFCLQ